MWATAAAPAGYLLCDGAAVSRTTYGDLFSLWGTTFGQGDNATTFNLPDLRGRVTVGRDVGQVEFDTIGETGGSKTTTAAGTVAAPTFTGTANIATSAVSAGTPAGTINAHTTAADSTTTGGTAKVTGPGTHTFTGSALGTHQHTLTPTGTNSAPAFTGSAVASLPPYMVLNFIVKT
jgi:microcystin-dependent protein